MKTSGFTLIELLVVIAIITLIASVVTGQLTDTRRKSEDAAIISNLANIRSQAELIYNQNGSYGASFAEAPCTNVGAGAGTLFADNVISAMIIAAGNAANGGGIGAGRCVVDSNSWAVSVPLRTNAAFAWCVDSTAASRQVTVGDAGITASGVCN